MLWNQTGSTDTKGLKEEMFVSTEGSLLASKGADIVAWALKWPGWQNVRREGPESEKRYDGGSLRGLGLLSGAQADGPWSYLVYSLQSLVQRTPMSNPGADSSEASSWRVCRTLRAEGSCVLTQPFRGATGAANASRRYKIRTVLLRKDPANDSITLSYIPQWLFKAE